MRDPLHNQQQRARHLPLPGLRHGRQRNLQNGRQHQAVRERHKATGVPDRDDGRPLRLSGHVGGALNRGGQRVHLRGTLHR